MAARTEMSAGAAAGPGRPSAAPAGFRVACRDATMVTGREPACRCLTLRHLGPAAGSGDDGREVNPAGRIRGRGARPTRTGNGGWTGWTSQAGGPAWVTAGR